MTVKNQTVDQMLMTSLPAAKSGVRETKGEKSADFNDMVRQKQQETRQTQRGEKQDTKDAKDTGTAKAREKEPAGSDAAKSAETQAANAAEQPGDEQLALAAAMLMQTQPMPELVQRQAEAMPEAVDVNPEGVLGGVTPDALKLTHLYDPKAALETPVVERESAAETVTVNPAIVPKEAMAQQTEQHLEQRSAQPELPNYRTQLTAAPEVRQTTAEGEEIVAAPVAAEAEAPVFGFMEAAPVKVSEGAEEPVVELESPQGMAQLGGKIEEFMVEENGESRVVVSLSPASLGKVVVEVVRESNGAMHIALTATTAKAASLLERGSMNLQQLLTTNTRPEVDVQVRTHESVQQMLNPDAQQQQQRREQQQQRQKREQQRTQDFIAQLRLGLVDVNGV